MPQTLSRVREQRVQDPTQQPQLQRVPRLCAGERDTGNLILHGDNLPILELLGSTYREAVRCIYIDPPYNNGEVYRHYRDDLEHTQWLRGIRQRLEALKPLLRPDGSLWISIDDREVHYLKVAADAVLGRKNFVTTVVWQQRTTRENRRVFSNNHEYILVYAGDAREFGARRNLLAPTSEFFRRYKNPDNDPRGPWQSVSANVQAGHATPSQFYVLEGPDGRQHHAPKGRCWIYTKDKMQAAIERGEVWFGRNGSGVPRLKRYLSNTAGLTPPTLWLADEVGTTLAAKKHLLQLFPNVDLFDTPKPESLLQRVLEVASDPGDLVLDAYLGSGTTAAVAHKMRRQYIGIESGEHAVTHCAERLRRVVGGDPTGISTTAGWSGGGGYDFYRLKKLPR
jgi:adenine-specific DNA-methyltransferase